MWGSDFGAAKLAVCKQLWERPDVTASCCAVLNAKWNIKIGFDPKLKLCWRESKRNKKMLKLEAIKLLPSSGFAGLWKRKQFIFGINKRERNRLAAESPMFTADKLGCAPPPVRASKETPGCVGFLSLFPFGKAPHRPDGENPRHCQETSLKLKPGFGK